MKHEQYNIVYQLLDRHVAHGAEKRVALIDDDGRWTYHDLLKASMSVQSLVYNTALIHGQRVMCILYDSAYSVACLLGLMRGGYVPCYLNPDMPAHHYKQYLIASSPALIICDELLSMEVKKFLFDLDIPLLDIGYQIFSKNKNSKLSIPMHFSNSERGAFCLFTSGTTAAPKGIEHRHKDIEVAYMNYAETILGLDEHDTTYSTSKLFFAYGLNSVLYALYAGGRAIIADKKLDFQK